MEWFEYGPVAVTEVLWTAILAYGAIRHDRNRRAINRKLSIAETFTPPPSEEALALYRNDRDVETDWAIFKTILATAGPVSMVQYSPPMTPGRGITIAILLLAIGYNRYRSSQRQRRRDRIALTPKERRSSDVWDGTERRVHQRQRPD